MTNSEPVSIWDACPHCGAHGTRWPSGSGDATCVECGAQRGRIDWFTLGQVVDIGVGIGEDDSSLWVQYKLLPE